MHTISESQILLEIEPMVDLEEFMERYQAFCEFYQYSPQSTLVNLGDIEDTLILSAVTGPHEYWRRLPAGINVEAWRRNGIVAASFEQWPQRVMDSKRLYKQVFHLREGLPRMMPATLHRAKRHLEDRTPSLVSGINRFAETLR